MPPLFSTCPLADASWAKFLKLEKTKPGYIQRERDEFLSVSLADSKAMQKMVVDILVQKAFCVYGSEEKNKLPQRVIWKNRKTGTMKKNRPCFFLSKVLIRGEHCLNKIKQENYK